MAFAVRHAAPEPPHQEPQTHAAILLGRYKHLIGPKLRARTLPGQQGEAALALAVLNRMIRTDKPAFVRQS
ncbi:MAG: hypothetical protein ACRYG8_38755 [Janthinobacterium lividum]